MKKKNISTLLIVAFVVLLCITTYGINIYEPHTLKSHTTLNKAEIELIIKDYILKNPELIINSLKKLEAHNTDNYLTNLQNTIKAKQNLLESADQSPVYGNPQGDITIVQFYDYRCGYCKKFSLTLSKILAEDKHIKVIFRELPILGEKSIKLSRIALAVNLLSPEKFWNFHNKIMEGKDVSIEAIKDILSELNIDSKKVLEKSQESEITKILEQNKNIAREANVSGTPTVIINGNLIMNPYDFQLLKENITEIRNNE
jgi:protein-disulfide isomerase